MLQVNEIRMGEHDHDQCVHILQKQNQNHWQSFREQNDFIKGYTPYLKDC